MTIREIANQIHGLSNGQVNGEHFSKKELETVFKMWMRNSDKYIGTVVLPDGEWFFSLERFGKKSDQYGYYIPETRDQERHIKKALGLA